MKNFLLFLDFIILFFYFSDFISKHKLSYEVVLSNPKEDTSSSWTLEPLIYFSDDEFDNTNGWSINSEPSNPICNWDKKQTAVLSLPPVKHPKNLGLVKKEAQGYDSNRFQFAQDLLTLINNLEPDYYKLRILYYYYLTDLDEYSKVYDFFLISTSLTGPNTFIKEFSQEGYAPAGSFTFDTFTIYSEEKFILADKALESFQDSYRKHYIEKEYFWILTPDLDRPTLTLVKRISFTEHLKLKNSKYE